MLPLTGMVDERNDVLAVSVTSQFEGYCVLELDLQTDWPIILEHEENMREKRQTVALITLGWFGLLQVKSSV